MAVIKNIDWDRVKAWVDNNKKVVMFGLFAVAVTLAVLAEKCSGS